MRLGARHAFGSLVACIALSLAGGCAKDPTSVFVVVSADAAVPPILILRATLAPTGDPTRQSSSSLSSSNLSDAADRPAPFVFPVGLPLTVDATFAGAVVVTVEGLDWDTHAVLASGSTDAVVAAQKMTEASLTLEPSGGGGAGDGGAD